METAPAKKIDASIQGWVNHVRFGNTFGLRRSMLDQFGLLAKENMYG
jgi:hypothetical protein